MEGGQQTAEVKSHGHFWLEIAIAVVLGATAVTTACRSSGSNRVARTRAKSRNSLRSRLSRSLSRTMSPARNRSSSSACRLRASCSTELRIDANSAAARVDDDLVSRSLFESSARTTALVLRKLAGVGGPGTLFLPTALFACLALVLAGSAAGGDRPPFAGAYVGTVTGTAVAYTGELTVGVEPLVVKRIVAPGVAQLMVTDRLPA